MKPAKTDARVSVIKHFTQPVRPDLKPTELAYIDGNEVVLPVSTSLFLIDVGARSDDNARRLNALQKYVNNLLQSIKDTQNIKLPD